MRPGFSFCSLDPLKPVFARRLPASPRALWRKSRSYCPDSAVDPSDTTRERPARCRQFTASLRALPALKDTELDAPMAMRSPVGGFRPSRAGRRPEAHDCDGLAARERLADGREHRADRGLRGISCHLRLAGDAIHHLRFIHSITPRSCGPWQRRPGTAPSLRLAFDTGAAVARSLSAPAAPVNRGHVDMATSTWPAISPFLARSANPTTPPALPARPKRTASPRSAGTPPRGRAWP